jgi:mRNA interferase YafQ
MYLIHSSKGYLRSYKKVEKSGQKKLLYDLDRVINILASKKKLPPEYRDHKLIGDYIGYRECHIRGDLLLIYQIRQKELILLLVDIGSHAYLF